jgi:hypothetical protein
MSDISNDSLATGMDVDVLDSNRLLAFASMSIQCFDQCRDRPRRLVRQRKIAGGNFKRLTLYPSQSPQFKRG